MSGFLEVDPDPATTAVTHLEQVAQAVTELLARTRGELTMPPALSGGGPTATQIMTTYGPQRENLNQLLDVCSADADTVGQTCRQAITQFENDNAETAGRLKKLNR
jgi:hypothetical protein